MFGSPSLDVAVGLVFMYWLLAVFNSVLVEWVASVLALRAKTLEAAIANLLAEDPGDLDKWLSSWRAQARWLVSNKLPGQPPSVTQPPDSSLVSNTLSEQPQNVKPRPPRSADIYAHGLVAALTRKQQQE